MIYVIFFMGLLDCLRGSFIFDSSGFVDVDKIIMRYKKYLNIFVIGDCVNLFNGKIVVVVVG